MHKLKLALGFTTLSLLTACSSSPDREPGQGERDVIEDTAPGLEGSKAGKDGVEVLPAGDGASVDGKQIGQGQNLGGDNLSGQDLDNMKMVDVDSIFEPVIYFPYDQYELDETGLKNARYQADILAANPNQIVILNGHTDERGTPEYNLALGEKRAKAVEQALMLYGISQSRIEVVSFGEEQPAEVGSNEAAWQKNRRVEIVIK